MNSIFQVPTWIAPGSPKYPRWHRPRGPHPWEWNDCSRIQIQDCRRWKCKYDNELNVTHKYQYNLNVKKNWPSFFSIHRTRDWSILTRLSFRCIDWLIINWHTVFQHPQNEGMKHLTEIVREYLTEPNSKVKAKDLVNYIFHSIIILWKQYFSIDPKVS